MDSDGNFVHLYSGQEKSSLTLLLVGSFPMDSHVVRKDNDTVCSDQGEEQGKDNNIKGGFHG